MSCWSARSRTSHERFVWVLTFLRKLSLRSMLSSVAAACVRGSGCSPIASILRRGSSSSSSSGSRGGPSLPSRSLAREQSSAGLIAAAAMRALDPDPSDPPPAPFRVAVVGGGLAGAAAASTLAAKANGPNRIAVTLFDAGFRGVGGRASSRPLLARGASAAAAGERAANPTTDHGCQFIVDDGADARLTALLRQHATEWREEEGEKRFVGLDPETGRVTAKGAMGRGGPELAGDFFGVLSEGGAVWVGAPAIDAIPRSLVAGGGPRSSSSSSSPSSSSSSSLDVRVGWRVTAVERERGRDRAGDRWRVSARPPAPHPPPPPPATPPPTGPPPAVEAADVGISFDAVVLSDASALRAGSASAVAVELAGGGHCAALEALARSRRAPLFSVAALLPAPLARDSIPFDVAVVLRGEKGGGSSSDVSVIVRESAKPGRREGEGGAGEGEVWVAVSSREAAAELLALAPPSRGPPPPAALEEAAERLWGSASEALRRAAAAAAAAAGRGEGASIPAPLALRAQRWGAGVETNPDRESLFSLDEGSMLAACGDVFGKGDAASALLSGVAAGEALLRAAAQKREKRGEKTNGARSSL